MHSKFILAPILFKQSKTQLVMGKNQILASNYGSLDTITHSSRKQYNCRRKMEANFDVDQTLPMSKVVENYFQPTPTPPSTSVRPLKIVHKLCAQVRKKNI
jgi:hypothetical protein